MGPGQDGCAGGNTAVNRGINSKGVYDIGSSGEKAKGSCAIPKGCATTWNSTFGDLPEGGDEDRRFGSGVREAL